MHLHAVKLQYLILERYNKLLEGNQDVIDGKIATKILETLISLNSKEKRADFLNRLESLYSDSYTRQSMTSIINTNQKSTNYQVSLDMFKKMLGILSAKHQKNELEKHKVPVYKAMMLIEKNAYGKESDEMKFEFVDNITKIPHNQVEEYSTFGKKWIEKIRVVIANRVAKLEREQKFKSAEDIIMNLDRNSSINAFDDLVSKWNKRGVFCEALTKINGISKEYHELKVHFMHEVSKYFLNEDSKHRYINNKDENFFMNVAVEWLKKFEQQKVQDIIVDYHIANLSKLIEENKSDIRVDEVIMLYTPSFTIPAQDEKYVKYLWKHCKNKPASAQILEAALNEKYEEERIEQEEKNNSMRRFLFDPIHPLSKSQFLFSCYFDVENKRYTLNPKYIIKSNDSIICDFFIAEHREKLKDMCESVLDSFIGNAL